MRIPEYKNLMEILIFLNGRERTILTDIYKHKDLTVLMAYRLVDILKEKGCISIRKTGRVCEVQLTEKGKALVKPAQKITDELR